MRILVLSGSVFGLGLSSFLQRSPECHLVGHTTQLEDALRFVPVILEAWCA